MNHFNYNEKPSNIEKIKRMIYIIKSYMSIEPCGYCGKSNDPETICYKCMPKE